MVGTTLEQIYIHTYGRSDDLATWKALPPSLQAITKLVVQEREIRLYDQFDPSYLLVLPGKIKRLSPTRQWLIDHSPYRYICMMDDDIINFGYRRDKSSLSLKIATKTEVERMFRWCGRQLEFVAHSGLSPRPQNHTFAGKVKVAGRMTQMLCYDLKVLHDQDFRFDRVPCMQDFDMTLQLLTMGFANRILFEGCTNARSIPTKRHRESKSGCDAYRTPAMQTLSAKRLAKLHAPFVRLREKSHGVWKEPVTDVTVSWKKAYESSQS